MCAGSTAARPEMVHLTKTVHLGSCTPQKNECSAHSEAVHLAPRYYPTTNFFADSGMYHGKVPRASYSRHITQQILFSKLEPLKILEHQKLDLQFLVV